MLEGLAQILEISSFSLNAMMLVFVRVTAAISLFPAFGEQIIPVRVRLMASVAFTLVVWPMVQHNLPPVTPELSGLAVLVVIEAGIGFLIGISVRLMIMALQLAGSIAAQTISISQIAGPAATPDPMPAIGNILVMAAMTLALVTGLHIKAALSIASTYEILPLGTIPVAGDIAEWGIARSAAAFQFAFSLAAPFVIAALAYNLALGAINRAMPALMVAFIGAPAITAGALLILLLAAPVILSVWNERLDTVLFDPLGMP